MSDVPPATVSQSLVTVGTDAVTLDYVDGSPCDPDAPRSRHRLVRQPR